MIDILDALRTRRLGQREPGQVTTRTAYLVDKSPGVATVKLDGSDPIGGVPAVSGDYAGIATVHVIVDHRGRPIQVIGPTSAVVAVPEPPPTGEGTAPSAPAPPRYETDDITVRPNFTGTYRHTGAPGWGKWGQSTSGFPLSLAQNSDAGSGSLTGLATYGSQLSGLGATNIDRIILTIWNASTYQTFTPQIQGVPHKSKPSGAPSTSGPTQTLLALAPGQRRTVALNEPFRDGFRDGSIGGLALVGGTSGWLFGRSKTAGMLLAVKYTSRRD